MRVYHGMNDGFDGVAAQLAQTARRLAASQAQQQMVWSNGNGVPVAEGGRISGSSPPSYGFQFLDPTSHVPTAFFGEDGTLGTGLFFYNATGGVASKIDHTGYHFYDTSGNEIVRVDSTGLHVYNSSGTEEVAAGLLNSSPAIYGLGVLPYGGSTLQMVGGFLGVQSTLVSNTTVTSWTDFGTPSSLTAEIGPSGSADVSVQAYMATGTAGEQAFVGVAVDAVNKGAWVDISSGSGGVSTTTGSSFTITGMSAGSHTFQLQYKTLNGTNCNFQAALTVQPL